MRLERLFPLSFYLALSLSAVTLAVSEAYFLPWLPYCSPLLVLLLTIAWKQDGRWILSEPAANYLGILIAIGSAAWILMSIPQTEEELFALGVPWPAGLLPFLGPLLIVLLVVKLFRPKRQLDFWIIQTVGLMMVMLSCVLAYQPEFILLLLLYLAGLLWSLALFYLYRESYHLNQPEMPLFVPGPLPMEGSPSRRRLNPLRFVMWTGLMLACSYGFFLILPRSTGDQWVPQKLSAGIPSFKNQQTRLDAVIDLRRVGKVELSMEEAFRVHAQTDAGEPANLQATQLWRTDVLDYYEAGRWMKWDQAQEILDYHGVSLTRRLIPTTPRWLQLRYEVKPVHTGNLPLAEPIDSRFIGTEPMIGDESAKAKILYHSEGTDTIASRITSKRHLYRYGQSLNDAAPKTRNTIYDVTREYRHDLIARPVPREIDQWTHKLLEELPSLKHAKIVLDQNGYVSSPQQALVAQALQDHLAFSGVFRYSLELTRSNLDLDPTADFLLNLRTGHCERYASGLTLMLRSVGIPARIVKGYRGCESSDDGWFLVRQNQAHSWVEALVYEEDGWVWITLDGTPGESVDESTDSSAWLQRWLGHSRLFWHYFVLEYNTEIQALALESIAATLRFLFLGLINPRVLLPILAFVGVVGWLRFRPAFTARANRTRISESPLFYRRFLQLLAAQWQLQPQPGQTPMEFSLLAQSALRLDPRCDSFAELPTELVECFYRQSYGGEPLSDAKSQELLHRVDSLAQSLKSRDR